MERRRFLKLGMVMGGTIVLGGAHRFGRSLASAAGTAVPTVDQLVMTNAVDNIYDAFAKGGKMGDVMVQRTPLPWPTGSAPMLLAEHGLAYHLESVRGAEQKEILLDFAWTEQSLTTNYQVLKIDPTKADALIVSHGHGDHYGALPDLARTQQGRMKPGLTLYAGGEDTFCHRWVVAPDGQKLDYGQLNRAELEARGLKVVLAKEPTVVAGHAFTSGQIPRLTDFEKPPAAMRLEAGAPGSGCEASLHFPPGTLQMEAKPGELVPDMFWGEHATAYHVKNRGLVIISSCGHAGIINSIRQIQQATGIDKVHAVVGGWHLAPSPEEIVAKTVAAFKQLDPDYLIPMHCTGFNTIMAIQRHSARDAREAYHALDRDAGGVRCIGITSVYAGRWEAIPASCPGAVGQRGVCGASVCSSSSRFPGGGRMKACALPPRRWSASASRGGCRSWRWSISPASR
jgi:7,8-dihydropterin-6-yl-methyl-4-(beta-D-ribofuranosyl)aminobenzene 5'-phosphate synthase